jgi:hypothetical protein
VSFVIFPRSEVAPVIYDYAYTMVEGKTPTQMPDVLAWVRAASGRSPEHPDPRLPLIG